MSDDAEWLRERPHIRDHYEGEYSCASDGLDGLECGWAALVEALPTLRAAIRADVVRELAGDADEHAAERIAAAAEQYFDTVDEEFAKNLTADINIALAAAHAQGRAAGREEAAKMADAKAQELYRIGFCNVEASLADNIATAIRSLP